MTRSTTSTQPPPTETSSVVAEILGDEPTKRRRPEPCATS